MTTPRIDRLRLHPITTRRVTGFPSDHVIVELGSGDLTGWGEMSDVGHLPLYRIDVPRLERDLGHLLAGQDPRNRRAIDAAMLAAFPDEPHMYARSGLVRQGVDLAVIDLVGKMSGCSAADLFGGALRERIDVCYPLFRIAPGGAIQAHLDTVARLRSEGFAAFRLYTGGDLEAEERLLMALASGLPDVSIKSFDFSNTLDWRTALRWTERLASVLEPELVESPAPRDDFDGLRLFGERGRWPVSEHAVSPRHASHLVSLGRIDILNIAPYVLGGLTGALRVAEFAYVHGVNVLIGTTQELALGTSAAATLGAIVPALARRSDPIGPKLYEVDVVERSVTFDGGSLMRPHGPGLGLEVDARRLGELRTIDESRLSASEIFNRRTEADRS